MQLVGRRMEDRRKNGLGDARLVATTSNSNNLNQPRQTEENSRPKLTLRKVLETSYLGETILEI